MSDVPGIVPHVGPGNKIGGADWLLFFVVKCCPFRQCSRLTVTLQNPSRISKDEESILHSDAFVLICDPLATCYMYIVAMTAEVAQLALSLTCSEPQFDMCDGR